MHKSVDDYTAKDIVTMRAILRSIQENEATVEQIFDIETRNGNGNGRDRRSNRGQQEPPQKPEPKAEPPKEHQVFAHKMAKAQSIDELESIAMKVGEAHQAGDISDDERDTLTEVYRSRKDKLTAD
jgi:hypothetical protein